MNDRYRFEPRKRARRRALQAIYQWQITAQDASEILSQFRAAQDMNGVDEEHLEELLRGVISRQEDLDQALQPFLDRPFDQVDQMERAVLRIGAYELLHCLEMPFRVVLDECVDLGGRRIIKKGHAFVNAVLDKAARQWRDQEGGQTPSQD
jgi:N utilization substance protein B